MCNVAGGNRGAGLSNVGLGYNDFVYSLDAGKLEIFPRKRNQQLRFQYKGANFMVRVVPL